MAIKEDSTIYIAPNFESGFMIPREQMPQIEAKHVKSFLELHSVDTTPDIVKTSDIKPTQSQFNPEKINGMDEKGKSKPILVSKDMFCLDGHHRWLANHYTGDKTQPVHILPWNAAEALNHMSSYEGSFSKGINEDGAAVVSIGGGAMDNKVVIPKKKLIFLNKNRVPAEM